MILIRGCQSIVTNNIFSNSVDVHLNRTRNVYLYLVWHIVVSIVPPIPRNIRGIRQMSFTGLYGKENSWFGVITMKMFWNGGVKRSLYLTSLLLIIGSIVTSQISTSVPELKLGGRRSLLSRSNRLSRQRLPKNNAVVQRGI